MIGEEYAIKHLKIHAKFLKHEFPNLTHTQRLEKASRDLFSVRNYNEALVRIKNGMRVVFSMDEKGCKSAHQFLKKIGKLEQFENNKTSTDGFSLVQFANEEMSKT